MNYFKKNKAITLLALVITIVVLVILGGTLLALALGDDGLIAKTKNSTSNYAKSKMKEETEVLLAEYIAERENTGITLKNYLDQRNIEYSIDGDGNIIFEKDDFFVIIDPNSLELEGPETIKKIVKIGLEPKIAEPGDTITATIEVGENVDLDNCKYAFLKKTDEEITEDKITEDLVRKIASNNINKLKMKTLAIAGVDDSKKRIEVELPGKNEIGTYRFYLLVAYKSGNKKDIKKAEIMVGTPVNQITLNKSSVEVQKDTTYKLEATISPQNATKKEIIWNSSDTNVATVNKEGIITGILKGKAIISAIATDGSGIKAECEVNVPEVLISDITLNPESNTIIIGTTKTINPIFTPNNPDNKNLKWESSDTSVAQVNNKGEVKAIKKGVATITATSQDGTNKTAQCTINTDSLTLTLYANNGTTTKTTQELTEYGGTVKLTNTFKNGSLYFAGWNTESDGTGTSYKNKQEITAYENLTLYAQWDSIINADSLLHAMQENDFENNKIYPVKVNGITYNLHVYYYSNGLNMTNNLTLGVAGDVATAASGTNMYAKKMVVLKVEGDITIAKDKTLTVYKDATYGGPKGFMIYCSGTITNNGIISMASRGAKAEGQNVYLWKNSTYTSDDKKYEFVPKDGANGGEAIVNKSSSAKGMGGKPGIAGTNRRTGGGGSGSAFSNRGYTLKSGAGAKGTSYSGGSGGGGADGPWASATAGSGAPNGGAGGNATGSYNAGGAGGGAGNPGGNGYSYGKTDTAKKGANGTGGLLIIYGKTITNNGTITANGADGGPNNRGGGSGGGSINIFYTDSYKQGTITANGGAGGGAGGRGSILLGQILNGNYINKYKNY